MKLTSYDLYKAGFVEKIIPEPEGYTLDSIINVFDNLEENISIFLKNSKSMTAVSYKHLDVYKRQIWFYL